MNKDTKAGAPSCTRRSALRTLGAVAAGGAALWGIRSLRMPAAPPAPPEPPTDAMTFRDLGDGRKVSLLGYGCMRFPTLPEADSPRSPAIDEKAAFHSIDYALDHGVNYFDTAWPYHSGASEALVGRALARHPRDGHIIATKMPGYAVTSLAHAKEIFEEQLRRLRTDHVDVYLLHAVMSVDSYRQVYEDLGVLDFLLQERERGRIRRLGWSFHGDSPALEHLLSRPVKWDIAMLQLNYHDLLHGIAPRKGRNLAGDPAPAPWMLEKVVAAGLPIVVMEPLMGGRLARLSRKAMDVLRKENPEADAASWAFRYVAGLPNVVTILSGMTKMEHMKGNLRTLSPFTPLSESEHAALNAALKLFLSQENIRCTTCGYCMPCPYGVDIPGIFSLFNRAIDDEILPRSADDPDHARRRAAFLKAHDRAIPDLREASRCTSCAQCVKKCPQMIDIPQEMARIGALVERLRTEVLL